MDDATINPSRRSARTVARMAWMRDRPFFEVHIVDGVRIELAANPSAGENGWCGLVRGALYQFDEVLPTRQNAMVAARKFFEHLFPDHKCNNGCRHHP